MQLVEMSGCQVVEMLRFVVEMSSCRDIKICCRDVEMSSFEVSSC